MFGLRSGHLPYGPGEESQEQGVPPEVLHVPGVPEAAEHGRGAVRAGREQVHLQGGLSAEQDAAQ